MAGNETTESKKYRLLNYMITVSGEIISASEFIFFIRENIIKETIHPAQINEDKNMLVINVNDIKRKNSLFYQEELTELLDNLPQWDKTLYYCILDGRMEKTYLTRGYFEIRDNMLPLKIVK
jgi:hypothetical protein